MGIKIIFQLDLFYYFPDYSLFWVRPVSTTVIALPFIVPGLELREKRPGTELCAETPVCGELFRLAFHPHLFFSIFKVEASIEEQCNLLDWLTRLSRPRSGGGLGDRLYRIE